MASQLEAGLVPPPLAKAHRTEGQAGASTAVSSFFARLNQDCVDVVVEYAADSVKGTAALRLVSRSFNRGVFNLVALLMRGSRDPEDPAVLDGYMVCDVGRHVVAPNNDMHEHTPKLGLFVVESIRYTVAAPLVAAVMDPKPLVFDFMQHPSMSSAIPKLVRIVPQVEDIRLESTWGDHTVVAIAQHCLQLRHLGLHDQQCNISDTSLVAIAFRCPLLETLEICRGVDYGSTQRITTTGMLAIAENCLGLVCLSLENLATVSDAAVASIATNCRFLTVLSLQFCSEVTDAGILAVAEHCSALEEFRTPLHTSDRSLCAIAKQCPELHTLHVVNSARSPLTAEGLMAVARECAKLEVLLLQVAFPVGSVLREFARVGTKLEELRLAVDGTVSQADTPADDAQGLVTFVTSCGASLCSLTIMESCGLVTDAALAAVAQHCPDLDALAIAGSDTISDDGVKGVVRGCPTLSTLGLLGTSCSGEIEQELRNQRGDGDVDLHIVVRAAV